MRPSSEQRGVGRPAAGEFTGKSTTLTTRLTPATKAALDREAKRNNRSLSQEVELRLVRSLHVPSTAQRDAWDTPRNKALAALVAQVARCVEGMTGQNWRENCFTWGAMAAGISILLDGVKPEGKTEIPAPLAAKIDEAPEHTRDLVRRWEDPAALGISCGLSVMDNLRFFHDPPSLDHPVETLETNFDLYLYPAIRRDLGLEG